MTESSFNWAGFWSAMASNLTNQSLNVLSKKFVVKKEIHLHAGTDAILNVTFIRALSHDLLKIDVPLVFRGDDISPGLKKGTYLNIINRTVKLLCPADVIPPYIDLDWPKVGDGRPQGSSSS